MGDSYIKRQQKKEDAIAQVAFDSGFQAACDLLVLVLRDPEYVSRRDIHGWRRLNRIYRGLSKYYHMYEDAWSTKKNADYLQEKLDANIREVTPPEHFEPFKVRHPFIKQPSYKHGRKGWR